MVSTRRSRAGKKAWTLGDKSNQESKLHVGTQHSADVNKKGAITTAPPPPSAKRSAVAVSGSSGDETISEKNLGRTISQNSKTRARTRTGVSTRHVAGGSGSTGNTGNVADSELPKSTTPVVTPVQKPKVVFKSAAVTSIKKPKAVIKKVKIAKTKTASAKQAKNQRVSTRASTRSNGNKADLYTGIEATEPRKLAPPRPKIKSKQSTDEETVIEVKMLTGTLYMYRGARPRAEFIRVV